MIAQNRPALNPNQQMASTASDRPLLIVAGAGTGKTRTLTMRILHLLESGVAPSKICALTFTNKAAREIESRVTEQRPAQLISSWKAAPPFLGTFHSLGSRVLRRESSSLERNPDFVIYDDKDSLQLVKKIVRHLGIAESRMKRSSGRDHGPAHFLTQISKIKNGMLAVDFLEEHPDGALISSVFEEYESALKRNNAFDFDDLIEKVVRVFKNNPASLARYHERFSHFLVDEYQDVNNMQYELLRLLAKKSGCVSVVGDHDQTIYSWRGSNFDILLNFERDWPGAQVVILDENYRSSQNIINAASALISNNKHRTHKQLWTKNDAGAPITLLEAFDEDDEAEWIAEQILSSRDSDVRTEDRRANSAILYRTNAQSRAIEQALLRRNIPYAVYGGLKFYERKEIRDVVAALRIAINPQDEVSTWRLEKSLSKTRLRHFTEALASAPSRAPVAVVDLFLRSTDYFALMNRTLTNVLERKENITELVEFASRFESLSSMIEEITLLQATDSAKGKKGAKPLVELMTMHLAKGLEFDRVFITGAAEGLLPHARSTQDADELEEERRLMYVAMTRARKELSISFYDIPSRFLSEIPEEYFSFTSRTSQVNRFEDNEERYITLD